MKSSVKSLLCAALAALLGAGGLRSQPAPKVVVIDLGRVFNSYWETPVQNAKIENIGVTAKKTVDDDNKLRNDLAAKGRDIVTKVNNDPTISAAAKADAEKQLSELRDQIQKYTDDITQIVNNTNAAQRDVNSAYTEGTVKKITAAAKDIARQKGANLLINKANINAFLWVDDDYPDISDEVLKSLNAGHETPPAATVAPAPAKPAATDLAPSVTFPAPNK